MYCTGCGNELPDDARFCPKCGKPKMGVEKNAQPTKVMYETCEIGVCDDPNAGFFTNKAILTVNVIGPKGSYLAGESRSVPGEWNSIHNYNMPKSTAETSGELDSLRARLMADGWEPTGLGNQFSFWTHTFKRAAN